ncbi:hypothetical protein [Azospirillum largimobile]
MGHGGVPGRTLVWTGRGGGKPIDESAVLEPGKVKTSLLLRATHLPECALHHRQFREWCATARKGSPSQLLFQPVIAAPAMAWSCTGRRK